MAELSSNRTGGNGLQVSTKNENLLSCAHALHKTLNLGISRCCLAEDGDEMYQNLPSRCTTGNRQKLSMRVTGKCSYDVTTGSSKENFCWFYDF